MRDYKYHSQSQHAYSVNKEVRFAACGYIAI